MFIDIRDFGRMENLESLRPMIFILAFLHNE
jgi:hypothetical protein